LPELTEELKARFAELFGIELCPGHPNLQDGTEIIVYAIIGDAETKVAIASDEVKKATEVIRNIAKKVSSDKIPELQKAYTILKDMGQAEEDVKAHLAALLVVAHDCGYASAKNSVVDEATKIVKRAAAANS